MTRRKMEMLSGKRRLLTLRRRPKNRRATCSRGLVSMAKALLALTGWVSKSKSKRNATAR